MRHTFRFGETCFAFVPHLQAATYSPPNDEIVIGYDPEPDGGVTTVPFLPGSEAVVYGSSSGSNIIYENGEIVAVELF